MEQQDITTQEYRALLEATPQEIRDFLFSKNFQKMIEVLSKEFNITNTHKLSHVVFDLIIGAAEEEETLTGITSIGVAENKVTPLFQYINTFFIEPLLLHTLGIFELEKKEEGQTETQTNPLTENTVSPLDVIQSIKERLSQKVIIPPVSRDHSIERKNPITDKQGITDPYRETPEL